MATSFAGTAGKRAIRDLPAGILGGFPHAPGRAVNARRTRFFEEIFDVLPPLKHFAAQVLAEPADTESWETGGWRP
jgi:hypothetical protein